MADVYIHSLTDLWNDAGTDYHAIKMNVTNSASSAASRLLTLQVGGSDRFYVDKNGAVVAASTIKPSANDGAALWRLGHCLLGSLPRFGRRHQLECRRRHRNAFGQCFGLCRRFERVQF
ncbi:hypothetical protein ACHMW7_16235 [Aminobacter sp. UC22_36]|uniref:hypothetical protein n=1 Tax=Aminobacter sp. UC22_36 TaxID=3374549 RepID=UPI0037580332